MTRVSNEESVSSLFTESGAAVVPLGTAIGFRL